MYPDLPLRFIKIHGDILVSYAYLCVGVISYNNKIICLGYQNIPVNLDEALRQIGGYLYGVQHHERAQRVTHSLEALDEGLGRR